MAEKLGNEEDVLIIPLSSDKIKTIAQALSNATAVRILQELTEKSMSATELSKHLNLPLTTIKYNINELLAAKLIRVISVKLSQKMREMKYYAPVKRALVFAPEKDEKGVIRLLKKHFLYLVVLLLSLPAGLILRHLVGLLLSDPHEIPIDPANLAFFAFFAGTLYALILIVIIKLLTRKRNKEE